MTVARLNPFALREPKIRTLHHAWLAFCISFVVWFSHAPLLVFIKEALGLSAEQIKTLMILNVALTIPSRIVVGILVDKFGPRVLYSGLLIVSGLLCFAFAAADSFQTLALFRFLLGFAGAGFVVGIRLVGEWFPAKQVGLASGIYGGWGNAGTALGGLTLPSIAIAFGPELGWRYAVAMCGVVAILYGCYFYFAVRNTPKGSTYFSPKKSGGIEVTSRRDFYYLLAMNVPMYAALGIFAWKMAPGRIGLLSETVVVIVYALLIALFVFQCRGIFAVNKDMLTRGVPEAMKYKFKQVVILDWTYFVTFGSQLAVVSMLPLFFLETFEELTAVQAAMYAAAFPMMNLAARPLGGFFSDRWGRRRVLGWLLAGMCLGYAILGYAGGGMPLFGVLGMTMICGAVGEAGDGAVFAMVPLVQRRMTGQIAGMAGAFGNVGGVCLLTLLTLIDYSTLFLVIAAMAGVAVVVVQFLDEPKGHMSEVLSDGTVQLIEVG